MGRPVCALMLAKAQSFPARGRRIGAQRAARRSAAADGEEAGDAARGDGEGVGDGARSDEEEAGDGASSDGDKACGGAGRRRRGAGDDGLGAATTTTNGLGASGANGSGWRNFHKCYLIYPEQWSRFVARTVTNAPLWSRLVPRTGTKGQFSAAQRAGSGGLWSRLVEPTGTKGGHWSRLVPRTGTNAPFSPGWCHQPGPMAFAAPSPKV